MKMARYSSKCSIWVTVLFSLTSSGAVLSKELPPMEKGLPGFALPSNYSGMEAENQGSGKIDCMIEPFSMVEVASSESGIVKEVLVERGSIVEKDEILAILESGVQDANAKHAAVKFEFHKKKYERLKTLYEQNVIAYNELEEAHTELELARHENQRASELLRLRTIRSPFSGVVVDKYISPGELTEQQKIVKIAQLNPLKVEIIAPLSIYGLVQQGVAASVWPEGPVKGPFEAKIDIVDKVIDAASGTFGISLLLSNPEYEIPAGVKCMAKLSPGTNKPTNMANQIKNKKAKAERQKAKDNKARGAASALVKVKQNKIVTNGHVMAKASVISKVMVTAPNGKITTPELMLTSTADKKMKRVNRPTAAELQDIVVRFVKAYEGGELALFESIFASNAKTNEQSNLDGIKHDYSELFANTTDRQLFITSLDWVFEENLAKGVGELNALVLIKNEGVRKIQGKIQFVAEKYDSKVRITHLYHYDLNVN